MSAGQERAVGLGQHDQVAGGLQQAPARGVPVALLRLLDDPRAVRAPPPRGARAGRCCRPRAPRRHAGREEALDHAPDRVALRVGHQHDRDCLAVPHRDLPACLGGARAPGSRHDTRARPSRVRIDRLRLPPSPSPRSTALRRAGHPPRRRARLRGLVACPRWARSSESYNALLDRRPQRDDLEALVLAPPGRRDRRRRLLRRGCARRSPTRRSAIVGLRRARSACAASPGGRGR